MSRSVSKWQLTVFFGLLVLIADLATKALARNFFSPWDPVTVIPGFFDLILVYNYGVAFSLFSAGDQATQGMKMAALALVSLLPFIYLYVKATSSDRLKLVSLGLIWGGALGNIHDRFRWGAVVDFIDIYYKNWHWPAFNVADMSICLGAGLLVLVILREKPSAKAVLKK